LQGLLRLPGGQAEFMCGAPELPAQNRLFCTGMSFCRAAFACMRPHNGKQGLCRSMPLCGKALFPVRKASYKKSREKEQNEKMKMAKGG